MTTLGAVSALYLIVENYTPLFDGYNGVYGLINPGQTALNLTYNGYRIVFLLRCSPSSSSPTSWSSGCRGARSAGCCGRCARTSAPRPPTAAPFLGEVPRLPVRRGARGLAGGLFATSSARSTRRRGAHELLVLYAAVLVGGRGNPRGVIVGRLRRLHGIHRDDPLSALAGVAARFGPSLREILIGLLIILMLKFRPAGIFPERPGARRQPRGPRRDRQRPPGRAPAAGPRSARDGSTGAHRRGSPRPTAGGRGREPR